ncbi:2-dehydropantoate 2-reductase [Horticoccus luteus]|uniref:2-dehydropantoate 2-reductase n=1 Tax=Horticoccus luteus TaxID=2862869 RepID=A0A8F9XIU2_9BACT|nr:2-dehydropantoate 2-reductase [Horticoccus luteus]
MSSIGIVGAGAIGAYFGAKLARAGADVRFLMRSDLAAVRERGLRIEEPAGAFTLSPVAAFGTTAEMGACDLVIIALKATANGALGELLPPLLHERTTLLPLQNGLGPDEAIAAQFGPRRVVGGLCYAGINRTAPGVIVCASYGTTTLGEFSGAATERTRAIAAWFERADLKPSVVDDLAEARWRKLVWNVPFNGLAVVADGGITTDLILADPDLVARARRLMEEVVAVAAALGHAIPTSYIDRQFVTTARIGAYAPSSLVDYRAGRAIEIEAIWGEPLRRARAAGVATPELAQLYEELKQCAG